MDRTVGIIVLAQLFGTSLWFSTNGVGPEMMRSWALDLSALGYLTASVQAGFIVGTLVISLTGIADRFPASRIFSVSAICGAAANACLALAPGLEVALVLRLMTGIALAGIYPLGMKLIISWVPDKAGWALGWLVGMLTLGTALPHLVRGIGAEWPWWVVVLASSILALVAALLVGCLGDGPHAQQTLQSNQRRAGGVIAAFRVPAFRGSALGYFGHMWELYAFWTITPFLVAELLTSGASQAAISFLSFGVIAAGAVGCVVGGRLSRSLGSAKIAVYSLSASGLICLFYPVAAEVSSVIAGILLLIWGVTVVADSPQFSALSARAAPSGNVGPRSRFRTVSAS